MAMGFDGSSGGGGGTPQEEFDPWAMAAGFMGGDGDGGSDGWNEESLNALVAALKGKGKGKGGKGCWECNSPSHRRSECPIFTAKMEQRRAEKGGMKGGGKQGDHQKGKGQNFGSYPKGAKGGNQTWNTQG